MVFLVGILWEFIYRLVSPTVTDVEAFAAQGYRPALQLKGTPTLVKCHPQGAKVGYSCTYEVKEEHEWIAAFPLGYGDGFWRALGHERGCIIRDKTGLLLNAVMFDI
jgi:alanine racemase